MLRNSYLALLIPAVLGAQQIVVVPSANALVDGNHAYSVAGTIDARRQLTLIDGSQLQPLLGRAITAISFRRNADTKVFQGGDAHIRVRMSHAARAWNAASPAFADNHGTAVVEVFHGIVSMPTSPGIAGNQVAWTPANVLRVQFTTPFVYVGGTLAVEVMGLGNAAATDWWPADGAWDLQSGNVQQVGTGCGQFGGAGGEWSFVNAAGLVPGASARFSANGPAFDFAMWAIAATPQLRAIDLSIVGAPGCFVHLQAPMASVLTTFGPPVEPARPALGGLAVLDVQIPPGTAFLGVGLASQWFALGAAGITSSPAHVWHIATQVPAMPMTLVTAFASGSEPATGKVIPGCGHVMAFDGF
jgi:hypothetical protein